MILADMGADVIRVDRVTPNETPVLMPPELDIVVRGRRMLALDIKSPQGLEVLMRLVKHSDALLEGFRPGVTERLGFGPADCQAINPGLVYTRITGFGQEGPLSQAAGHDINYISLVGALAAVGRAGQTPVPPLNLVADNGGGAMLAALGTVCALLERSRSGLGQVVDAAMIDGSAILMTMFFALRAANLWSCQRGENLLDSGTPFYDVYETSDGGFISVGALESKFFAELVERLELDPKFLRQQFNRRVWPEMREQIAQRFRSKTRAEWQALLEGTDACTMGVLTMDEVIDHPHNQARQLFARVGGAVHPAPAPRFDRTLPAPPTVPKKPGSDTDALLRELGYGDREIAELRGSAAVA
jgi:alpha-methylacyl-CoA racemase